MPCGFAAMWAAICILYPQMLFPCKQHLWKNKFTTSFSGNHIFKPEYCFHGKKYRISLPWWSQHFSSWLALHFAVTQHLVQRCPELYEVEQQTARRVILNFKEFLGATSSNCVHVCDPIGHRWGQTDPWLIFPWCLQSLLPKKSPTHLITCQRHWPTLSLFLPPLIK